MRRLTFSRIPSSFIHRITSGRPQNYIAWRSLLRTHPQPRFSLRPCASEALLGLKVRMNPMFHEPLTAYQPGSSWSGIALLEDMQHSMLAVPLLGERSYAFWGSEVPSNKVSPLELPGRPHPPCWLREPLQTVDEPHIRLATNPLKEFDDTRVSSCEGLDATIAVSERIRN
jgi:hypothetical protein